MMPFLEVQANAYPTDIKYLHRTCHLLGDTQPFLVPLGVFKKIYENQCP